MQKHAIREPFTGECAKTIDGIKLHVSKMRRPLLPHMLLLRPMEVSKMRNPTNIERVVRIRRKLKENRYFDGKRIYKREQMELTIPSKFRDVIEPFLDKDLKVEAKQEDSSLIIEAKPVERSARKSNISFVP